MSSLEQKEPEPLYELTMWLDGYTGSRGMGYSCFFFGGLDRPKPRLGAESQDWVEKMAGEYKGMLYWAISQCLHANVRLGGGL